MKWYLKPWKKYAVFTGITCDKEYYIFNIVNIFIIMILVYCAFLSGFKVSITNTAKEVLIIFVLASLIPSWALEIRRYNDPNRKN